MAIDMFLDLGKKVPGESKDQDHKDQIEVLSWEWDIKQPSAGKVDMQDVKITKWVDKSSPVLMLYCSNGDNLPSARMAVRKAGKQALEYVVFDLENVRIVKVHTSGSEGDERLKEEVSLNFNHVTVNYTPQKGDGSGEASIDFLWDVEKNASV
jgi:type VI secretion system secreted protein Hcp